MKIINSIKSFFSSSWSELQAYAPDLAHPGLWGKGFLLFTAVSALLIQFSTYSAVLFNTSEVRPIVATVDDDTQEAIRLAEKTFLFNDNGARAYGPTYYRGVSVTRFFGANPFYEFSLSPSEQRERSSHFSLMTLNLLSIFAYCFLLASLVHSALYVRLGLTVGLVHLFLQNELRATLTFMGKPDHLLVLFISLAFLQSWKWLQDFESKNRILKVAAAWALAATTKLSVLFFAPGFIAFWLGRKWLSVRWTFMSFVKWIVIFYFLIGFPQTLDVPGYLSYLIHQNSYTSLVTWEFFTGRWLALFSEDLKRVFPFLLVLVPVFHPRWSRSTSNAGYAPLANYFRLILFCLLGFIFITHKKTTAPFEWYTFPLTNILLMTFVLSYQRILDPVIRFIVDGITRWGKGDRYPKLTALTSVPVRYFVVLALMPSLSGGYSDVFYSEFKKFQSCRPEARAFKKQVDARAATGAMILADSTAPYDHQYHDKNIHMTYEMKTSDLQKFQPKFLALKKSYYSIYLPRAEGGQEVPVTHITNMEDTRNFYRTFFNKTKGTDVFGQSWKLVYTDACTFELWERP